MKKITVFLAALALAPFCNAQGPSDQMQIFNYSRFTMGGHVSARNVSNCFPALRGQFSDNLYPDNDPLGRNITVYKKFINSHTSTVPINQWLVATTANAYMTLPANPVGSPVSNLLVTPFAYNANWGGIEVEYWDPFGGPTDNGGFALNYDVRMNAPGSPNVCLSYPMDYVDANVTVTSFYLDPAAPTDYIVIIKNT